MTMSASATQWNPPPQQMPLIAVMTGFHTPWCHDVKWTMQWDIRRLVPAMLESQTPIVCARKGWTKA